MTETFNDPDCPPPSHVTKLTDHTGDLLVRLADDTWIWAHIGGVAVALAGSDMSNGFDWADLVGELPDGGAFRQVTS